MVESAASSSINLLGKILLEEGKYLWGVEEKVNELREELVWMRSFLRKADAFQHMDEIVSTWVCQVQKYIYESEDVIEKFVIKVVSLRNQHGWLNKMKRYSCIFIELYQLHRAASSIDSLKVNISTLSPKLEKYGLMRTLGVNTDQVEELRTEQIKLIQRNVHMEEKKIIGLEKNTEEIIKALTSTTLGKGFHAIYGMGGSGKTTLATKVMKDDVVKQHFPGGQAFAYVSKKFKVENVLQDLLKSLNSGSSSANLDKNDSANLDKNGSSSANLDKKDSAILDKNQLDSKLREILKRKCLIVLDDVWTKQAWDSLKTSFTSCEGELESKLLLTTRKEEVAKHVDDKALQKTDLLDEKESLQLLQETMGWHPEESSPDEQDETEIVGSNTESEKIELGKKMAKICKGVPLSVVVIGGILRKKQSVTEWKSVLKNISSHLLSGYDHGRSCTEILLQSYDDLPYHLRPCFLHLAGFPEDHEIETKELYWMWVGEGLVTRSGRSKSIEDVANDYLRDLAEAGLVQIVKTSEGLIKTIRMHDLVRDMCLEKASADNLVKIIDQNQIETSDYYNYYYNDKRLLRTTIVFRDDQLEYGLVKDCITPNVEGLKYIRSLISIPDAFGKRLECQQLMRCICSEFQVLRVLVLRDLHNLSGRLSSRIGKLVHLRYLSLRGTRIKEVPSSISELKFLEIIDLRVFSSIILPNNLWKLVRLRHLLLPSDGYKIKWCGKLRVDTLICLESIVNLRLNNLRTKDMLKIRNLRKFSIKDAVSKESLKFILHVLKSSHLQSCSLEVEGAVISENMELLSSIVCNCKLEVSGQITLPPESVYFSLPPYLKHLRLYRCGLENDPLRILGSMCHLEILRLDDGCYIERR